MWRMFSTVEDVQYCGGCSVVGECSMWGNTHIANSFDGIFP